VQRDPERRVEPGRDRIEVDGAAVRAGKKVYLMLNKPRGLVTTTDDEHGRATVYECLKNIVEVGADGAGASSTNNSGPRVFAVGRLDKASEGLLLFTNDSEWADRITSPTSRIAKVYHVQVECVADDRLFARMHAGVTVDGDFLTVKRATLLRQGEKNSWLEVILEEGKNRHIRRLLSALGVNVLRLMRVAVGSLKLGSLAKGQTRTLTADEIQSLASAASTAATSASTRVERGKSDGASKV
jgi:23S rRNA pseudouridine2605 synthase